MTEIVILIAAMFLDMVIGGRRLLGGLPDIDRLSQGVVARVVPKLNRDRRGPKTLLFRGLIFFLFLVFLYWQAGQWLEYFLYQFAIGDWLVAGVLFLFMRQRIRLDQVFTARRDVMGVDDAEGSAAVTDDPHRQPRVALQDLYDGFFSHCCAVVVMYIWQGLAAVFAFRIGVIIVQYYFERHSRQQLSPFYLGIVPLYNIASFFPAVLSTFCLLAAGPLIAASPRQSREPFPGLRTATLWGRDWALWAASAILGYSFYLGPEAGWSGPTAARARLLAKDMLRGAYLYIMGWLIVVALCGVQILFR